MKNVPVTPHSLTSGNQKPVQIMADDTMNELRMRTNNSTGSATKPTPTTQHQSNDKPTLTVDTINEALKRTNNQSKGNAARDAGDSALQKYNDEQASAEREKEKKRVFKPTAEWEKLLNKPSYTSTTTLKTQEVSEKSNLCCNIVFGALVLVMAIAAPIIYNNMQENSR